MSARSPGSSLEKRVRLLEASVEEAVEREVGRIFDLLERALSEREFQAALEVAAETGNE